MNDIKARKKINKSLEYLRFGAKMGMYAFGRESTIALTQLFGRQLGQLVVVEFPKSGGTWLKKMCSTYLDIPLAERPMLPVIRTSLIHSHTTWRWGLNNAVYLIRDGRDIMVSMYFHKLRLLGTEYGIGTERLFRYIYGKKCDFDDVSARLPRFIEYEMKHSSMTSVNWSRHVEAWQNKRGVVYVKYEDLLIDTISTLTGVIQRLIHDEIDSQRLKDTVSKFEFSRVAGRAPGSEDRQSFMRKGIAGDWKNYFTKDAAEIFAHYCGETLISVGYESDESWVKELTRSKPSP